MGYIFVGGAAKTMKFGSHNPMQVVPGLASGKHTVTLSANASIKIGALFTRYETKQTLKRAK